LRGKWLVRAVCAAGLAAAAPLWTSVSSAQGPSGPTVDFPAKMAALGDSISLAFDAVGGSVAAHPALSWSTGSAAAVDSQYLRLLRASHDTHLVAYLLAKGGAQIAELPFQAEEAVRLGVGYVTILIGANDLCAPSVREITPPGLFRADLSRSFAILERGLPLGSHIFVASIPNLIQLWEVEHTNPEAQLVWNYAGLCGDVLGTDATDVERQEVLARERVFNSILLSVCARYSNCRSDGLAVFNYRFSAAQVSSLDYFHPSVAGQAALAAITWAHGFWAGLP